MKNIYYSVIAISCLFIYVSCSDSSPTSTENNGSGDSSTTMYQLVVSAEPGEGGSVSPASNEYEEGTSVEITATANDDWVFVEWTGDQTGTTNPVSVTMNGDKDITALFIKREYPLTVNIQGEGAVSERVVQEKSTDYPAGTTVELTANAAQDWVFVGWSGDIEGDVNPETITIDQATEVTAIFERKEYSLTVNTEGEGTVTEEIVQDKSTDYESGTKVRLTATPANGWTFVEWEGDITGAENPAAITVDEAKEVTAVFERRDYPLTINIEGEGSVDEEVIQAKTTNYPYETNVQLTANPAEGWVFSHWKGDATGSDNPVTIEVTDEKTVTAVFERRDYPLTINIEGEGSVDEEVIQAKTTNYPYETNVQLTANPAEGWVFSHWEGDATGSENPVVVEISEEKAVTAVFEKDFFELAVTIEGEGSVNEELDSGNESEGLYEFGSIVKLTATAGNGWQFDSWSGDSSGDENPIMIEIGVNNNVTATFARQEFALTITTEGEGTVSESLISGTATENGYLFESEVELTAEAAAGWEFVEWQGDLTGTNTTEAIIVDVNKNVVAVFQAVEGKEINLLIGDSYTQAFPGGSVVLPDEAGAVYRVGVMARDYQRNGASVLAVPNDLMLKVREVGSGMAKSSFFESTHSHRPPYKDDRIDDDTWELMQRTQEVHHKLRIAEQSRNVEGMTYTTTGEPSMLGSPVRSKMNSEAEPEAKRTFFISNPNGGGRIEIEATLRKNGANVIYYHDDSVEGTSEEATDQEIEDLLAYYDQYGKPVIDEMFGGLGPDATTNHFSGGERMANDIDGNGKFIVLQLHADNMIGGAAGYVSSCDRFPLEENYNAGPFYCEKSNEAEITYLLRPESDFFLGALVHEAKHISSHGYAVFTDREYQPSWIEEGTAEIANEMTSRRASGFSDQHEVTFSDIYPGMRTTSLTTAMAIVHSRARSFLYASPESGLIGNPSGNPANSDYYGSGWLFHRYLADNYADNNQNQFFRQLNDGTHGTDLQSLTSATGKGFDELLDEFVTAIQIEGKVDAKNNSPISFSSYDFEEIASYFTMGDWPYLYEKSEYDSREVVLSPVYYTSPVLFEFTSPGGSTLELELLDGDGESLNSVHEGALIITRVE